MTAEQNSNAYINPHSPNTPEPTNETKRESWQNERRDVLEGVESDVSITTSTFVPIATGADVEEATGERLGECQAPDMLEYWTLGPTEQLWPRKESKDSKIVTNEPAVPGVKICDSGSVTEFWCSENRCHASIRFDSFCGEEFKLEIMEMTSLGRGRIFLVS